MDRDSPEMNFVPGLAEVAKRAIPPEMKLNKNLNNFDKIQTYRLP